MTSPARTAVVGYFDSVALVKRYVAEVGTTWVQSWCRDPNQTVAVTEIGLVEIAAAFAGKLRGGFIAQTAYDGARADLEADARTEYVLVSVDRPIVDVAIELTSRHSLRGHDAVHLASALRLDEALLAPQLSSLLIFVSADNDLLTAARAEGLSTENPNNYQQH